MRASCRRLCSRRGSATRESFRYTFESPVSISLDSIPRDGFRKLMVGCSLMFLVTFLLFAALKSGLVEKEPGKVTKETEVGGDFAIEQ